MSDENAKAHAAAPDIDCERLHPGLTVRDVNEAIEFYTTKLGFKLGFRWDDPPTMAGVNLGRTQVFLHQGAPVPSGCAVYFLVDDADELHEFHRNMGVEIAQPPQDQPYNIRDYVVRDLYGYYLSFGHYLLNPGPPIKIERVDMHVRLEKRLVALLHDLARYKRMSLTSCLEEILLHTNEPLEDGVATPHTRRQIAYIQELKKKHGIDYDSHASYRFVE